MENISSRSYSHTSRNRYANTFQRENKQHRGEGSEARDGMSRKIIIQGEKRREMTCGREAYPHG